MLPPTPVFRDGDPVIKKVGDGRPVPAPRPRKGPALDTGNAIFRDRENTVYVAVTRTFWRDREIFLTIKNKNAFQ